MPIDMYAASSELTQDSLLQDAQSFADSMAFDQGAHLDAFPERELMWLLQNGFGSAALPQSSGGLGLGAAENSGALLELLQTLGRANLSLGRVYEGHVNALILIDSFGTSEQQNRAAVACQQQKLFALWNTDGATPARLTRCPDGWKLCGEKAFASAAMRADCLLVTAERADGGRQMCFLDVDRTTMSVDSTSWRPLGMSGSESFLVRFDNHPVTPSMLVGSPGDYYRPPLFLGGAIRTSAIHLGGAEALLKDLQKYAKATKRTDSTLLRRRAALIYSSVELGKCWIASAARVAERTMTLRAATAQCEEINFVANLTRIAIEKICSEVTQLVLESVGARGLNQPYRFGNIIRDLTMFLRQPDPDRCISDVGRAVLEDLHG